MLITALIILAATTALFAVVVFVVTLVRAPEGAEDETGFHYAKAPEVAPRRRFRARTATVLRTKAKPFKTEIPVA